MKGKSYLAFSFALVLMLSVSIFAQDMKPEAGKLYNAGNRMLKSGNYTSAITKYDKALKINKDYRIYYQRGVAYKKSRKYYKAKASFEMSLKLKKDFGPGYNALGGINFSLRDYETAAKNFEYVLSITKKARVKAKVKRNLALAYTKLGAYSLKRGRTKKAITYLTKAVQNRNYDAAYLTLAEAYNKIGSWRKSLAAAQKALKYRSSIGRGGPYFYMGIAYKNVGNVSKAKKMFKLASRDASYRKTAKYELASLD